jgi:hypothetical protein
MGDGSFGCQCTWSGASGHRNGRWTTVPGHIASSSASSVALSTAPCVLASCGWPNGRPNGNSIAATRGAPQAVVRSGIIESAMVAIPAASTRRCARPTDRQQMGQTGTKMAASTPSARIRLIIAGTERSRNCVGSSK